MTTWRARISKKVLPYDVNWAISSVSPVASCFWGQVAIRQGDDAYAEQLLKEGIALFAQADIKAGICAALRIQGELALAQRQPQRAKERLMVSIGLACYTGPSALLSLLLELLAEAHSLDGQRERAVQLLGAAQRLHALDGDVRSSHEQADYERRRAAIRQMLDDATFATLWHNGEAMSLAAMVDFALHSDASAYT